MSRSRRFFEPNEDQAHRGPSDEMLAVDAATEMRSMTLLYERWADRLYRYFLLSTADPRTAERMMRDLISRLPEELQRFAGQERSFGGWLFARASEVFWREYSFASRFSRRVSRYIPARKRDDFDPTTGTASAPPVISDFDEISTALAAIPADRREVLGIHFGAELKTVSASEALRIPASLMSSHIQWAVQSLAEQLDVENTRRLSEDLADTIQQQSLTSQERQHHFKLIHGVFLGEVEIESDEPERAPIFEIGALVGVVVLGLLGIWIWGLITEGDTRQHEVASPPPAETTAENDDDATPTPEATGDDAVDDEEIAEAQDDAIQATCLAVDGKAHFDRFVRHFNDGDFDELAAMLPETDDDNDDSSTPVMVTDALMQHDGQVLIDSDAVLPFLQDRYENGERWDILQAYPAEHYRNWHGAAPIEMYQDWKQENPGLSMIIVAGMNLAGENEPQALAHGRVVIDCDAEELVSWDIQEHPDQQPLDVGAEDFVNVMSDLEEGEARSIRARAMAESRPDGGALTFWEVSWTEARLGNGETAKRAEISTLDNGPIITYVDDGDRWQIDKRGWPLSGDSGEEVLLPDEIALVVPWFEEVAAVLGDFGGNVDEVASLRISEDYTDDEIGARERQLDLSLRSGVIENVQVREQTVNGKHLRPEFQILEATRTDEVDEAIFELDAEPEFPEIERSEQRYDVPDQEYDKLDMISMTVGDNQAEEQYRIAWNDVEMDLYVRPSRGGLDPQSVPQSIDDSWTNAHTEYDWGTLVWAYRHFAGYPTDAIWDDGRYLFVIAIDREDVSAEHDWDLDELIELANTLSADRSADSDQSSTPAAGGGYGFSRVSATR